MSGDDRDELAELFATFARTRDRRLRDRLVAAHLPLATHLARRFANRGEQVEDLEQVAALALVLAVERFDPDRGLAFSTFAAPTILGELKRHFRDRGWTLRVPRRIQELHLALAGVVERLTHDLGRPPTVAEIAAAAGAAEEEVLEALDAGRAYRADSLDAPDDAAEPGGEDPDLERAEVGASLAPLLERLPARERLVVHLRFFEHMTQSEIAARLGISQVHVSRLLARSLRRLREAGSEDGRTEP
jgi:RNA polymerase sigma-B factor